MQIHRMTLEEIPAVAALELECFSQPWSGKVLAAELGNPNAVFFTALEQSQLTGYAGMHRVLDEGYIANIAVRECFRRQGVAALLLEQLLDYAAREKLGFVTLEVRAGNIPALRFYEKSGFGQVGRRKNFYANPTEDALLMTRFL